MCHRIPYFSAPLNQTNRHQKMEVGTSLEILEYHQMYKIWLLKKL